MVKIEVDALGLKCPMPLLKARLALKELAPGEGLRLWADDATVENDFTLFGRESGHSVSVKKLSDRSVVANLRYAHEDGEDNQESGIYEIVIIRTQ